MRVKKNDLDTKRKTFEFPQDEILVFLETKDNQTQYIRKLIKADMMNNGSNAIDKNSIINIIKEYLIANNITGNAVGGINNLNDDIMNSITSIIGDN